MEKKFEKKKYRNEFTKDTIFFSFFFLRNQKCKQENKYPDMNSFSKYVSNFAMRSKFSIENNIFNKSFVKKKKERKKKVCGSIWKATFQSVKLPLHFQRRFIRFWKYSQDFEWNFSYRQLLGKNTLVQKNQKNLHHFL